MILFRREKKKLTKIHEKYDKKINMYSRTPISFTIQFQTLIFVIFANRVNIRIVRKILGESGVPAILS